jgi:hypothetical protein
MDQIAIGDLVIMKEVSPKMLRALTVIANHLHPIWDRSGYTVPDQSKDSCVLMAVTVRDFLHEVGFRDARASPVCLTLEASVDDKPIKALDVGQPWDHRKITGRWAGHLVVTVPSEGILIDTVLYQSKRPEWPGLAGMMAVSLTKFDYEIHGLTPIAGIQYKDGKYRFMAAWLDYPANKGWRTGGDAMRKNVRVPVIREMVREMQRL